MQEQQSDIFGYIPPPPVEEAAPVRSSKSRTRDLDPNDLLKALTDEIDTKILDQIIEKAESIRRSKELAMLTGLLKERIDTLDDDSIEKIQKFIDSGCQFTSPVPTSRATSSKSSRGTEIDLEPRHLDENAVLAQIPEGEANSIHLGEFMDALGIDRNNKSYIQKFKRQLFGHLLETGLILRSGEGRNTRYFRAHLPQTEHQE